MGATSRKRRFGRPHWIAVLTTLAVGVTIVIANLDGHYNHLFGAENTLANDPRSMKWNWAHGWPWSFAVRRSIYPLSGVYSGGGFDGPAGFYSRWPVDQAKVIFLGMKPLLLDCLCAIVLIFGAAYGAQRLATKWNPQNAYGLKTMFVGMALVGLGITYGPALFEDDSRYILHYVTLSVTGTAAILTLFAAYDMVLRLFRPGGAVGSPCLNELKPAP